MLNYYGDDPYRQGRRWIYESEQPTSHDQASKSSNSRSPWEDLPKDLWLKIYSFLDPAMHPDADWFTKHRRRDCSNTYRLACSFAAPYAALLDSASPAPELNFIDFLKACNVTGGSRARFNTAPGDYYAYLNQPWSPKRLSFLTNISCRGLSCNLDPPQEAQLREFNRQHDAKAAARLLAAIQTMWSGEMWEKTVSLLNDRGAPVERAYFRRFSSLDDNFISNLSRLSSLKHLTIVECLLSEPQIAALGGLRQLRLLHLDLCPWIHGDNVSHLWNLKNLTNLRLLGASLDERGLDLIDRLPCLSTLDCRGWTLTRPLTIIPRVLSSPSLLVFVSRVISMHHRSLCSKEWFREISKAREAMNQSLWDVSIWQENESKKKKSLGPTSPANVS